MSQVVLQLEKLWSLKMIHILFEQLFSYNDLQAAAESSRKHRCSPTKSRSTTMKLGQNWSFGSMCYIRVSAYVEEIFCFVKLLLFYDIATVSQIYLDDDVMYDYEMRRKFQLTLLLTQLYPPTPYRHGVRGTHL